MREVNIMVETYSDNFVVQCLRCDTPTPEDREQDDIYCQECASPLVNKCTNDNTQHFGNHDDSCGITLDPEAVYCKKCATISLFASKELIENKYPDAEIASLHSQTQDEIPF